MADTPVTFIKAWLSKQQKAAVAPNWNGGWERWAQGQVAIYWEANNGWQVFTEQRIYQDGTKDAVDLEFRKVVNGAGVRSFCELKCYGAFNNDTANTFINNIMIDYVKVQGALKPEYKNSRLWVIGLSQQAFRDSIVKEGAKGTHPGWENFKMDSVDSPGQPGNFTTFGIWYWSYVNNN